MHQLRTETHQLFLNTIRDNPGCVCQDLINAGISRGKINLLIAVHEPERIKIKRNGDRKITGIWIKETV